VIVGGVARECWVGGDEGKDEEEVCGLHDVDGWREGRERVDWVQ
jgi:hypothetical protein